MASHYKLAVVTGGLFGCAVAVRVSQNGFANQNVCPGQSAKIARISPPSARRGEEWPEGLALHTAVLMDVSRGETLVKVTYPMAG
jgi:hypothetical protein